MSIFALVVFSTLILIVVFLCFWAPSDASGLDKPGPSGIEFQKYSKSYLTVMLGMPLGLLAWRSFTNQPVRLFFGDIFLYFPLLMLVSPGARRVYLSLRKFFFREGIADK